MFSFVTHLLVPALLLALCTASPIFRRSRKIPHNVFPISGAGKRCTTSLSCSKGMVCNGSFLHRVCIPIPGIDSRPCQFFGSKCEDGRVCAGTLWTRRCVKTMQEGESCGSDPFWVCGTGLSCKSNICRPDVVKVGGICLAKESQCEQGAVCAGTSTSKRCVMPMEENENCGSDPFWVCKTGLSCRNNTCKKPLVKVGGSCLTEGSECEQGTICVGTKTSKRCVKPMEQGENCGTDPFWVCRKELSCRNNICRKPLVEVGGSCLAEGSECEPGTVCVGTKTSKRCVKPLEEGVSCGNDVFGVCRKGLTCRNDACRKPLVEVGGSCLAEGSECEQGTICVGSNMSKRCVKPLEEGGSCGTDAFAVCQKELSCRGDVCRKPLVKNGGSCLEDGSECEMGTTCVGTVSAKRCVQPLEEGDSCGNDAFEICQKELNCRNDICRKPLVKVGGSCLSEGSECEQGTVCVGTSLSKRCVKPLENGEACGNDPFWVCEDGLTCRNDICRMPLVKVGESCAAVGSECEKGTVCIGTKTSKRCVKPLEEGESCGSDEFGVCQKELTCRNDTCRKPLVKVGGSCLAEGSECITGAVCVGTTTSKRCVKPLEEGESCGSDAFGVCKKELTCRSNICRKPLVKVGGSCLSEGSECEQGTVCVGTMTSKRCVKPLEEGESCGRDPFWVCESGLSCRNDACRKPLVKVGGSCVEEGSECEQGLICNGSSAAKRCVKPLEEGEKCGRDALEVCQKDLTCRNNICRQPLVMVGGSCLAEGSECIVGAVCAGTSTSKRCVKPIEEGESCGSDSFAVCRKELRCRNDTCRKPLVKVGGSCLAEGSECEQGSVCVGTNTLKQCVKPLVEGDSCGSDAFEVCQKELTCRNNICRKPLVSVGESCLAAGSECVSGAFCVGKDTSKRCVKPMEEGESCGVDSFTVCKKELNCRNNTCRKPFVKVGGSCLAAGSECENGTVCAGTKSSKRCVKPMREGESCGRDPFWVCVKGLDCRSGTCRKAFVKVGESCLPEGSECEQGTVCAGTKSSKRCVKPMQKGERCGTDPFWVCDSNLSCFYNVCKSY